MLQVRKNEISLRKCSGDSAQLPTLEGTLQWCTHMEILQFWSNPKLFHRLHIQSISENMKLWTPISKSETAQSISH